MIWFPTKWWGQRIGDEEFVFWTWGSPPGLIDSGQYCGVFDLGQTHCIDPTRDGASLVPSYYQCLSCCCTPAKCQMPAEILMTIDGFAGTLSSIDRPAAYGYGPSNVCNCPIGWEGACGYWFGYTEECCKCRKREDFFWWPRYIEGENADGGDMCERDRPICKAFPSLCQSVPQTVRYLGRIAARYIKPCGPPCTDIVFTEDLIQLTDCAKAPDANALRDWECISRDKIEVVIENDSYLPPPGFRGPGAVNLLPLCDNKFWNDTTYYRNCVSGGFWCQIPFLNNNCYSECGTIICEQTVTRENDFFWHLTGAITSGDWRNSQWCIDSPTRCQGPVPVEEVRWRYFRPRFVLISQPSSANCAACPGYGYGYGSSFTNYGQGTDWYDPYDDGHCIGKTDVAMEDFNQSFMLRSRINEAPPNLCPVLKNRSRDLPVGETRFIDVQLLYQVTHYAQNEESYCDCVTYDHEYWRVDYPCEPKTLDPFCECYICDRSPGQVAPKLRAYYLGDSGSGAEIAFILKNFCPPLSTLGGFGPVYNGSWWYVASVSLDDEVEEPGGAEYKVGDEFVFDFYESPARGGEAVLPSKTETKQRARVTKIGDEGQITEIKLIVPQEFQKCAYDVEIIGEIRRYTPIVPLYCRYLTHRYAVGIPGNAYAEGDILEFQNVGTAPENIIETGNRFYPYFRTANTYRSRARATVIEVDSRGGVVDWYMCGAQNTYPWLAQFRDKRERECSEIHTGQYYDYKYENKCEYNYVGFIPVRYAWSGFFDYQFHKATYCEHAWAEFSFRVDQISVKNTVSILPPPQPWGKQALAKIKTVGPMEYLGETIDPIYYQNYEISPGPNDRSTSVTFESSSRWYKSHQIPVPQGRVVEIEVLDKGAGYVKRVEKPDGTFEWQPLELATYYTADYPPCEIGCIPAMTVRGVTDDMRAYMQEEYGWPAFCICKAHIKMDVAEDHPNFGGIDSIEVLWGGFWYFTHTHDHVWLAKVGSNWYFELAEPAKQGQPRPQGVDYDGRFHDYDCWHASRDNWGEIHHYDGFYEPYLSGYHSTYYPNLDFTAYSCQVATMQNANSYVWPTRPQSFTGSPGMAGAGDYRKRWSTEFCPNDLLNKDFRMILVHPCAACAKELNLPGGQTCWNMGGYGDTTYNVYPNVWGGTGTAMITRLGGELTFTVAIPSEA